MFCVYKQVHSEVPALLVHSSSAPMQLTECAHQLSHGRDVIDQPNRLPSRPLPAVRVAIRLGLPAARNH